MSDEYVICPGCNKRIRPLRRYPLEPLAKWFGLSVHQTCRLTRMAGTTEKEAQCHGITRRVVDRICGEFKAHPSEIWPEVVDHDIEDCQRPCEYCKEPFHPAQHNSRYCSKPCRRKGQSGQANNYRRKRYAEDPEYRERKKAAARRYAEKNARARAIKYRLWRERNTDYVRERNRDYAEANRDQINANKRARYQRGKGMTA